MNSEDRSAGVLDFAFRRRFSHFHFEPDCTVLQSWLEKRYKNSEKVDIPKVVRLFKFLNKKLKEEDTNFQVGHSYFMRDDLLSDTGIEKLWKFEITPLLNEHFFHEKNRINDFELKKLLREVKISRKEESENKAAS